MKKLNYVKFSLDFMMILVFTLLFNKMVLGLKFHEVAGLLIGTVILVHCGLNWKWIKGVTLRFFNSKIPTKTRIGYVLNVLLLVNVGVIIISGIFISKILFGSLNGTFSFKFIHISSSYLLLMLIGIHLGLHWNWVMLIFKKIIKIPEKRIYPYISKIMVVLVLVFGIYSINSVGYISKLSLNSSPRVENSIKKEVHFNQEADFTKQTEGNLPRNLPKDRRGPNGDISILSVITTQLGVISVFSIITYYLEKLLNLKRKK